MIILNINEIINRAIDESVRNISKSHDNKNLKNLDSELLELVKSNELLMSYSNTLLINYHEELKKALKQQGITI